MKEPNGVTGVVELVFLADSPTGTQTADGSVVWTKQLVIGQYADYLNMVWFHRLPKRPSRGPGRQRWRDRQTWLLIRAKDNDFAREVMQRR